MKDKYFCFFLILRSAFMFNSSTNKIFCIGLNKTGTTTIRDVLGEFGFKLGDQARGELLMNDWSKRNFKPIIKFSKTADAFQDIPFSLPYTYPFLDNYFKNAKFILTQRDSSEQWYSSLTKFHSKLFSDGMEFPSAQQLKNADYRYKGFTYNAFKSIYGTTDDDLYNREVLEQFYASHNHNVKRYFKPMPNKLITINVAQNDDYKKLCTFLNKKPLRSSFPITNKS